MLKNLLNRSFAQKKCIRAFSKNLRICFNLNEIPLSVYYPATPEVFEEIPQARPKNIEKTTLSNGLTIVADNVETIAPAILSVHVSTGSRYEEYSNNGVSHFIERFFYSPTNHRTRLRLVSELQKTGANVSASAGREEIVYRAECIPESFPRVLEIMTDSILYSRMIEYDMPPHREEVQLDLEQYAGNPRIMLSEALHQTAFNNKTLGRPLLCPPHRVNTITAKQIVDFMNTHYTPDRITIYASNYKLSELAKVVETYYSHMEKPESQVAKEPAVYTGGDLQMHETRLNPLHGKAHSVLAFKGAALNNRDSLALEVLAAILGEGSNKYTGTTRGSQSILAQSIVARNEGVLEAQAFNISHSDAGLFGVYVSGEGDAIHAAFKRTIVELRKLVYELDETQFKRGLNRATLDRLSSLETSLGFHEFTLSQITKQTVEGEVTLDDVKRVITNLLKEKPTIVSYGDLNGVPTTHDLEI